MTLIRNKDYKRSRGDVDSSFDKLETTMGVDVVFDAKEHIDYIIAVVDNNSDQWITIKHLLQRYMPIPLRRFLTAEDYSTKKQKPNDFEYAVMNYWKQKTGTSLIIPEHKMHPDNHVYRPRGWKLAVINELRKRKAIEEGRQKPDEIIESQSGKRGSVGRPAEYKFNRFSKTLKEYFESLENLDQGTHQGTTEVVNDSEGRPA